MNRYVRVYSLCIGEHHAYVSVSNVKNQRFPLTAMNQQIDIHPHTHPPQVRILSIDEAKQRKMSNQDSPRLGVSTRERERERDRSYLICAFDFGRIMGVAERDSKIEDELAASPIAIIRIDF